jgi:CubicO group peptidase (beta-lactamase class C family)
MGTRAFGAGVVAIAALAAWPGPVRGRAAAPDVARIDEAVRSFVSREGIGAAHVTVLHRGEVVLERGYGSTGPGAGPPDSRTVFPVGSISKQFTAAAILSLADEGKLRLDAPVGDLLPEWFAAERGLTLRHLLTHTSGIADFLWLDGYRPLAEDPATPKSAFVALAAAAPRRFAPGERWAYSNTNYKALALITERVSGRPFDAVLTERVLRPAGIDSVGPCHDLPSGGFVPGFAPSGKAAPLDASRSAYAGDGGLCASAAGLATWLRRGLTARGGERPLLERLATPTRLSSGQVVPYGFGVSTRELLGQAMIWHGGNVDGHSALVAHAPQDDLDIVVLTNKGFVWLTEILPAWIGEAVPARAKGSGEPPLGVFDDDLFRYEISAEGADLKVAIDKIGPLVFVPAGPGRYVARDYPATFLIRLPGDGSRDTFEVDWGELRSYARRVGTASGATPWPFPWPEEKVARYTAFRTTGPIAVDGRLDEADWTAAPRSPRFSDLVRGAPGIHDTRAAVLWDEGHLYVAYWVEEPLVEAKLTERDSLIYTDNDVELFVAGKDAYYELEINALGTIYEVFFVWEEAWERSGYAARPELSRTADGARPFRGVGFKNHPRGPRIGFWRWDLPGLRTAVHVDGTLNDNRDRDRGWTVEIAIPWAGLVELARPDARALPPRDGDVWRMDFSRFNQYKEAPPAQDPGGWAWSPHGVWDSHVPEVFPHVRFSTEPVPPAPGR